MVNPINIESTMAKTTNNVWNTFLMDRRVKTNTERRFPKIPGIPTCNNRLKQNKNWRKIEIRYFNPPVLYINSFNFHSVPQKCNNKCITQRYYLSNLIPIQYHRNLIVNVLPKGITCTSVSYIIYLCKL